MGPVTRSSIAGDFELPVRYEEFNANHPEFLQCTIDVNVGRPTVVSPPWSLGPLVTIHWMSWWWRILNSKVRVSRYSIVTSFSEWLQVYMIMTDWRKLGFNLLKRNFWIGVNLVFLKPFHLTLVNEDSVFHFIRAFCCQILQKFWMWRINVPWPWKFETVEGRDMPLTWPFKCFLCNGLNNEFCMAFSWCEQFLLNCWRVYSVTGTISYHLFIWLSPYNTYSYFYLSLAHLLSFQLFNFSQIL